MEYDLRDVTGRIGTTFMAWDSVDIALPNNARASREYVAFARALQTTMRQPEPSSNILALRKRMLSASCDLPTKHQAIYRASALILTDLALQGWQLMVDQDDRVAVTAPLLSTSREQARKMIRMQELLKRDAQLAKPSVKAFINSMEHKRLFCDRFVSIYDLMRDGRDLSNALRNARSSPAIGDAPGETIKPYVQFVETEKRCLFTGLRLMDIWRYFRHTWTNQYTNVPGRSIMLLVRDAAAVNHPVMGIAAISSPIIQIRERDMWLGWHPETFVQRVQSKPTAKLAIWLHTIVDTAIKEIYAADFVQLKLVSRWRIKHPTLNVIRNLRDYAAQQKKRHVRFSRRADFQSKETDMGAAGYWRRQARTPLFKSKRAQALAELLGVRMQLHSHFGTQYTAQRLEAFVDTHAGRKAIAKIARKAKADRVGIAMADISVCGAVQPYNALLGGKLVSMLAVSPSVVAEYKRRYSQAVSQIASSMAGRPIVRAPNLVYFGTTSLYGNGSSQYNRIKVPATVLGGTSDAQLMYQEIGQSESYGTSQFSDETVNAIVVCLRQSTNGERVHSIFGEGVSPRLRKIREGLTLLGFPEQTLLQHGRRRSVYGIMLATNVREYLMGIDQIPRYIVPVEDGSGNQAIVSWWRRRWLSGRIQSDQVLEQVAQHRHIHPICHGARVPLSSPDDATFIELGSD